MNASAWERMRQKLLHAVVESKAMPLNQMCAMNQVLHCDAESVVLLPFFAMHAFSVATVNLMCSLLQKSGRLVISNWTWVSSSPSPYVDLGSQFSILGDGLGFSISGDGAGFSVLHLSIDLGSQFSISGDGAGFSVLHLRGWSWVLSSPPMEMELGSKFSISRL